MSRKLEASELVGAINDHSPFSPKYLWNIWLRLLQESFITWTSPKVIFNELKNQYYHEQWSRIVAREQQVADRIPDLIDQAINQLSDFIPIFEQIYSTQKSQSELESQARHALAVEHYNYEKGISTYLTWEEQLRDQLYEQLNMLDQAMTNEEALTKLSQLLHHIQLGQIVITLPMEGTVTPITLDFNDQLLPAEKEIGQHLQTMAYHYVITQITYLIWQNYWLTELKTKSMLPDQMDQKEILAQLQPYAFSEQVTTDIVQLCRSWFHRESGRLYAKAAMHEDQRWSYSLVKRELSDVPFQEIEYLMNKFGHDHLSTSNFLLKDALQAIYHFSSHAFISKWSRTGLHPSCSSAVTEAAEKMIELIDQIDNLAPAYVSPEEITGLINERKQLQKILRS